MKADTKAMQAAYRRRQNACCPARYRVSRPDFEAGFKAGMKYAAAEFLKAYSTVKESGK